MVLFRKYFVRVIKPMKLFYFRRVGLKMLCNLQVSCCVHQSPFQGVLQEEVLPLPLSSQTRYFILRREICVLFLYHVNYWYQSVTWHEYLITSFILWFSGWISDQHMKEAEFALYWVGLTRHLCLSPGSVKSSNDVDSPKMKSCTFCILSNFWKSDFVQCWVDIVFVGLWSSCNSKSTIKG